MRQWRFDNCISDITDAPITNYLTPNIRGTKDLPSLTAQAIFFNFAVPSYAPYQPYLGGVVWGGLMGDWHMRKAFTYSFNYAQLLWIMGEGTQPANPIISGLPFYDPTDPKPVYNPDLAKWHFKMAWGGSDPDGYAGPTPPTPGQAWTQGFALPIVYNIGGLLGQLAAQMWEAEIQSYPFLGPVDIQPLALSWATLLPLLYSNQLPNFILGWMADFPDPHDIVFSFMHPEGNFAGHQNIAYGGSGHLQLDWSWLPGNPSFGTPGIPIDNAYVGALIEEGARQTGYFERNSIYRELADIYYDEAASIMLYQPLVRHWEKKWVQGWYYNPVLPGLYFYHLWKGLDADLSGNGVVYLEDIAVLNAYWWDGIVGGSVASYNRKADKHWPGRNLSPIDNPPPGPGPEDRKADTVEMDDDFYLTGLTGTAANNCWEAFGIPAGGDGFVDIFDAALINAQWLDP